uniref:Variant surface glycoprotein 319 n=1 Tax=Trypanosoma brucei TaxID=5691 RepID=M4SXU6_9TRYP|nr:variant surface glycoprotein 319 [Trypanosoma brucei]
MNFLLAASLVFASSSVVHCNDGDPLLATAVNIVCKLRTGLKATPARFTAILSTADAKLSTIRSQELKGRLYKLLNNGTDSRQKTADIYARAAAIIRTKATTARDRMAAAAVRATAAAALAAGRMDEAIMLVFQAKGASDACLSQSESTNTPATTAQLPNCFAGGDAIVDTTTAKADDTLTQAHSPAELHAALNTLAAATVKTSNGNKIAGQSPVHAHNTNCVITKGSGGSHKLVTAGQNTVKLGDGLWEVGAAQTDHGIWPSTAISAEHRPTLHAALEELKKSEADYQTIVNTEAILTDTTGTKIPTSAEFQQALQEATGGAKIDQPVEKLKAMFKTDSPANFQKEFCNPFYTTQILSKSYGADPSKPENLGDKTDTTELDKAMDFYLTLTLATIASKSKEISDLKSKASTAANKPEEVCNKITDTDPKSCNATENCHFVESNDKGKKCTLKKEIKEKLEKESQENGGSSTGVDCSKLDTKPKCEEVNKPGKPATCGWRKGKDNEPDQDKEMCRNGSYLPNKQFALVVSAAFVALLF